MPKYCFICGRNIDTIGYYVDREDGFICESCASKCSLSTQNSFKTKSKDELITEIEKSEWAEAAKRPNPVQKKRVKGVNRFAWIALALLAIMFMLTNLLAPDSTKKSSSQSSSITSVIPANVFTEYPQNLSAFFLI